MTMKRLMVVSLITLMVMGVVGMAQEESTQGAPWLYEELWGQFDWRPNPAPQIDFGNISSPLQQLLIRDWSRIVDWDVNISGQFGSFYGAEIAPLHVISFRFFTGGDEDPTILIGFEVSKKSLERNWSMGRDLDFLLEVGAATRFQIRLAFTNALWNIVVQEGAEIVIAEYLWDSYVNDLQPWFGPLEYNTCYETFFEDFQTNGCGHYVALQDHFVEQWAMTEEWAMANLSLEASNRE